jgi:hypothetical protein
MTQAACRAEVHSAPPKPGNLRGSATALLQAVTAIVPLPSSYCSTGIDSRSHRRVSCEVRTKCLNLRIKHSKAGRGHHRDVCGGGGS